MIADHDDVLTEPIDWTWTFGDEHDPVEPSSALLPGRVDDPASNLEGSSAIGQFDSQTAASAAADSLSGICVAGTVILPGQPYPWGGVADQNTLRAAIDRLTAAGARDAFITDADTGHLTYLDVRAHCENRHEALAIGHQLVPIMWPPWVTGLIKPWAPGRTLSEEQVRARMYIASLWRRSDRPPRDELESKIWQIWRAWQEVQETAANQLAARVSIDDGLAAAGKKHEAALRSLLGEEVEGWGSPWYLQWKVRVENNDVCLSWVWCMHVSAGFPALVRWLERSGVKSAEYGVYNLMRP